MSKIVFIGAGSCKFVREVIGDLFSYEELQDAQITLMDIDRERLERSERLVGKIIRDRSFGATVEATLDQRKALEGADYILITIMVGGYEHYYSDVAIPAKYGVLQTISDTVGPGGVFRTVRTAPVLQKLVEDVREVAPRAWILNYANPMAMNCLTMARCGQERVVGLCHSIQGCFRTIAKWLELPPEEITYTAAGINHVNFYLTLEHNGRDVYPLLRENAARIVAEHPDERARFELLEHLGYFPAEGPLHQTEYYPWFRKSAAMVEHYAAETFAGYNNDFAKFKSRMAEIEEQTAGRAPIHYYRSAEYGARIIHSLETGKVRSFYGNVPNRHLIENLPDEAIVEVPCLVDQNGVLPCHAGRVPPQLAAVMSPHIALHELAVTGVLAKDRRLVRQAIQADPLTSAVLTLPQIEAMTNELFEENAEYTQGWA